MSDVDVLHASGASLGEAALWHQASGQVLWLDLLKPALYRHDPGSGETTRTAVDLAVPLGALIATDDPDRVLVSAPNGLSVMTLAGEIERVLVDPESGRDEIAYNDCKMDRFGRLWIGTHHLGESAPRGALWCCDADGKVRLADAGFPVSNGPAVSPDGSVLYFNDSVGRRTFAYDLSRDAPLARNRRVFAAYSEDEGLPDGVTVDAAGGIWVAHWGGARVTRLTPDGRRDRTIALPCPNVTSVAFCGEALDRLVITTAREGMSEEELAAQPLAGHVFACTPGETGIAEPLFALE